MFDLTDLVDRYAHFYTENDFNTRPPIWKPDSEYVTSSVREDDFRNDNAYVWQTRMGDNYDTYADYYQKLAAVDHGGLFDKTHEDGLYGCQTWDVEGRIVSRDLLDSILEIYFMQRAFGSLNDLNILEIGAGYGRLCKRYRDCYPDSHYFLTDGIAHSTYLADIYLSNYGYQDSNIELPQLTTFLSGQSIDVALNIHSFPEQDISDVEWWVKLIDSQGIDEIFYVPNDPDSNPTSASKSKDRMILDVFAKYGYQVALFANMYDELNIGYSYVVPFYALKQAPAVS